eukprot:CAMPEP_0194045936 /NCGR_PEP_ID=MMETSP0009_2-20130614/18971_1 /TAXON_ID=210454 /ORGANISM="Grammatophora oceanica, Strain CCMP 410" /LENGTH=89 /DNA_ID=CAMNT_0038690985 /DNA_START=1 /DNA_END=267 /DNA_ORIENTATION=-
MQAVGTNSFDIRLQTPGSESAATGDREVHCVVMEEGVWMLPDGEHYAEAKKYTSTVTDRKQNWVGQSQALINTAVSYNVFLGQVMTSND